MAKLACAAASLFAFALLASGRSPADNWSGVRAIAAGTEVRVKVNSRTIRGQIEGVSDDALTIRSRKGPEIVARPEVLGVSLKTKSHRGRNTLIGLAAGAGIGLVAGAASHRDCTGFCILNTSRAQDAAIGAIVFGAIGTAVGALIPTGRWSEVYRR